MNTPTPRDVERVDAAVDGRPGAPEGLLEGEAEATVPEVIPTPKVLLTEPRVDWWNRNRLLAAALGLAAVIAIGFGTDASPARPGPRLSSDWCCRTASANKPGCDPD